MSWVGGSGDWSMPANWSTDSLPGTNDDVVIGAGASTPSHIRRGRDAGPERPESTSSCSPPAGRSQFPTPSKTSNTFTLSGGTLQTATVVTTNGASLIVDGSGTLDGVTVNGVLDVGNTYNNAVLAVVDGLTLNGKAFPTRLDVGSGGGCRYSA